MLSLFRRSFERELIEVFYALYAKCDAHLCQWIPCSDLRLQLWLLYAGPGLDSDMQPGDLAFVYRILADQGTL